MRKFTMLSYIVILIISFSYIQCGRKDSQITTIFLVRHVEKVMDGSDDPVLTEEGIQRANELVRVLQHVKLDAIYDTPYKRTTQTVQPIADHLGQTIQTIPSLKEEDLKNFVDDALIKHKGQKILIASHSNIVPALLKLIRNEKIEMQTMKSLEDSAYDDLFVVVFTKREHAKVLNLKYGEHSSGKL